MACVFLVHTDLGLIHIRIDSGKSDIKLTIIIRRGSIREK